MLAQIALVILPALLVWFYRDYREESIKYTMSQEVNKYKEKYIKSLDDRSNILNEIWEVLDAHRGTYIITVIKNIMKEREMLANRVLADSQYLGDEGEEITVAMRVIHENDYKKLIPTKTT